MEVAVDGVRRATTTVDAAFWRFYEVECELGAGVHEVKVTFCNDTTTRSREGTAT